MILRQLKVWLLDVNVDIRIRKILREFGIASQSSIKLGWRDLTNGHLLAEAVKNGYKVLLTRDQIFSLSAQAARKKYPGFSIVILTLREQPFEKYSASFRAAWSKNPISPNPGRAIFWPKPEK